LELAISAARHACCLTRWPNLDNLDNRVKQDPDGRLAVDAASVSAKPRRSHRMLTSRSGLLSRVMTDQRSGFGRPIQFRFMHHGGDWPTISGSVSGVGLPITLPLSGRLPSALSAIAGARSCDLPGAARDRRSGCGRA
jgi:hypothetical protein